MIIDVIPQMICWRKRLSCLKRFPFSWLVTCFLVRPAYSATMNRSRSNVELLLLKCLLRLWTRPKVISLRKVSLFKSRFNIVEWVNQNESYRMSEKNKTDDVHNNCIRSPGGLCDVSIYNTMVWLRCCPWLRCGKVVSTFQRFPWKNINVERFPILKRKKTNIHLNFERNFQVLYFIKHLPGQFICTQNSSLFR